ncbi:Hsp70 family protein [Flavobacterium psychrophilum]
MEIYDNIVDGLKQKKSANLSIDEYLQSLQKPVKALRVAYRNMPAVVAYENKDTQAAYLTTYLPHYYQLIYKIFLEDVPEIFQNNEVVSLTFIGGGPGSEAYGAIKYIVNNCPKVKNIQVTILDINADTWSFSHEIVFNSLIKSIIKDKINVDLNSVYFDLISSADIEKVKMLIQKSDLLVIQNCLNEVANINLQALRNNINLLFKLLPSSSYLLMSDLTSGVRTTIKALEKMLIDEYKPAFLKSTLSLSNSISVLSVHHEPNMIIKSNLLTGSDGLIPRKWIKYDYSILSKGVIEEKRDNDALGFNAIYRPLDFKKLDANDFIHKKTFVGIDFGTSTTVVGIASLEGDRIILKTIPIKQKSHLGGSTKSPLVPTVISLVDGNKLLVGKHAAENKPFLEYGKNTWHSFKQNLNNLDDECYPNSVLANNPLFKISNAKEGLTFFFKYIKNQIFEYLVSENLSQDVEYSISVPAAFSSKEKQNLKFCLLKSGIDCEDTPFMDEPNAALINYLFEENANIPNGVNEKILVLDLGAGTVDVSILNIESNQDGLSSSLLSIVRLGNIGGNVIDEIIAQQIIKKNKLTSALSKSLNIELVSLCEQLKIKLCRSIITDKSVNFELPSISKSHETVEIMSTNNLKSCNISTIKLNYNEFNNIMVEYWQGNEILGGIKTTIDKALNDANFTVNQIDKIIVTGGGGRNPYIKSLVASLFHKSQIIIQDNIQEQVARGVALQSFVLNSFGKNIITPILSNCIYIEGSNKRIELFETGIAIPSDELDIYIEEKVSTEKRYILSYSGLNKENIKYFEIPENESVEKLVFYIAPDQELKCDIIYSSFVNDAKELFDLPDKFLIKLK